MGDRSLRVDAAGRPHIAYGGDHLYYAWHDGTAWHFETADAAPGVGQYASLALDGAGQPHIAYYDSVARDLRYARRDASGWVVQVVAAEGDVGFHAALGLDAEGRPHIAYYDDTLTRSVMRLGTTQPGTRKRWRLWVAPCAISRWRSMAPADGYLSYSRLDDETLRYACVDRRGLAG